MVGSLGLTTGSAAGATAANSTQSIFSSLASANVTHVDTSKLTTADISLGTPASTASDGTVTAAVSGSTVTVGSKVFEFVQSGNAVATTGDIAVSLSSGFSVSQAMSALVSAMNGAGVDASVNSDGSLAVSGASGSVTNTFTTATDFAASAGTASDQLAVGFKGGVSGAITALQNAITKLSSKAQTLGNYSNQITGLQTYTSNLNDSMTTGVGALTDADMAAESAKLTSLQTKQQLAISTLSIAKSSSQNILSLFR